VDRGCAESQPQPGPFQRLNERIVSENFFREKGRGEREGVIETANLKIRRAFPQRYRN